MPRGEKRRKKRGELFLFFLLRRKSDSLFSQPRPLSLLIFSFSHHFHQKNKDSLSKTPTTKMRSILAAALSCALSLLLFRFVVATSSEPAAAAPAVENNAPPVPATTPQAPPPPPQQQQPGLALLVPDTALSSLGALRYPPFAAEALAVR